MELASLGSANVVRFRSGQAIASGHRDQKCFMDAVYAAGSLPVAANDEATKRMATRLTIFGFVTIEEVSADGSTRRLKPSEAFHSEGSLPWRVSKPTAKPTGAVTLARGESKKLPRPFVA